MRLPGSWRGDIIVQFRTELSAVICSQHIELGATHLANQWVVPKVGVVLLH